MFDNAAVSGSRRRQIGIMPSSGGKLMLEVRNLSKEFLLSGGRRVQAVNGVSFTAKENETIGIVGESGCGKSTLGRLILRLLEPSGGKIFFRGEEISSINRRALGARRQEMQMIFQNPFASFNPKIRFETALMEVCLFYGMNVQEGRNRIEQLFADTGLSEDLLQRWPRELSGGQLQRLAIVRSLISEPSLLIADEPLSALDVSVQAQLLNLLRDLRKTRSMLMMFISHDMTVVEYFCDRVAVMYLGRIMEIIPAPVLSGATASPGLSGFLHPYTRALRASSPRLDAFKNDSRQKNEPVMVKGEPSNPLTTFKGCPFAPRCTETEPRCMQNAPEYREVSPGHWISCHHG
jgi:oligopeptide/dipeptide ABC transporter ATP-binding protein